MCSLRASARRSGRLRAGPGDRGPPRRHPPQRSGWSRAGTGRGPRGDACAPRADQAELGPRSRRRIPRPQLQPRLLSAPPPAGARAGARAPGTWPSGVRRVTAPRLLAGTAARRRQVRKPTGSRGAACEDSRRGRGRLPEERAEARAAPEGTAGWGPRDERAGCARGRGRGRDSEGGKGGRPGSRLKGKRAWHWESEDTEATRRTLAADSGPPWEGRGGGPESGLVTSGEENWLSLRAEAKPRPRPAETVGPRLQVPRAASLVVRPVSQTSGLDRHGLPGPQISFHYHEIHSLKCPVQWSLVHWQGGATIALS